jgi:uncharacterized protein (UPF0261 family)
MTKKAVLIGALDTKGMEYQFVKEQIEQTGLETLVIDTGVLTKPYFEPDIPSSKVASAGGITLEELRSKNDRGTAVATMTKGVGEVINQLLEDGVVGGVFGMGGTAGTTVVASAMKNVPIGIPKVIVSTVASGNTRPYVGEKDVTMMYSIVDISGINSLSKRILSNAANAISGMINGLEADEEVTEEKPMIGITMFGVTTPCVTRVRELCELQGYDVLVFHATGAGGLAMEELVKAGYIKAVADVTTTELADELVGGIFTSGPDRLEAAGNANIPQVVSVGALDMVNFGPPETVPEKFKDRHFYQHNPTTTLMRTTVEENYELGKILASKLNKSNAPTVLVFPKGGVSLLDTAGQAFDGVGERNALYKGIKETINENVQFIEVEDDINSPTVSTLITEQLFTLLKQKEEGEQHVS